MVLHYFFQLMIFIFIDLISLCHVWLIVIAWDKNKRKNIIIFSRLVSDEI